LERNFGVRGGDEIRREAAKNNHFLKSLGKYFRRNSPLMQSRNNPVLKK